MKLIIKGMELELPNGIYVAFGSWLLERYPDKYVVGDTLSEMAIRVIKAGEAEIACLKKDLSSTVNYHLKKWI